MSGPSDAQVTLGRVVRLLGEDFVRYIMSVPDSVLFEELDLSGEQHQVLDLLSAQTTSGPAVSDSASLDLYMRMSNLTSLMPGANTSVVNYLREFTGGQIEVAQATGDGLVDSLIAIAHDVWPVYLARPQVEGPRTFWMSTPTGLYNHPALGEAIDNFISDARLMKLFPFPPERPEGRKDEGDSRWAKGMHASLVISSGHGGSLQLLPLVTGLLANAVFRCLIAGEKLGLQTLTPHLVRSVEDLRVLADGRTVNVPALVGLAGVGLPDGATLELPEGRLRPANSADRELFMSGSGSLVTVLETVYPLRLYSVQEHRFEDGEDPFRDFSKYAARISEVNRSFAHELDFVRLSLFLASTEEEPWLAREVARYIPDILSHGGSSSWDPGFASLPAYELPHERFKIVQDWHALIRQKHVPSLDIGMRRLLSATTARTDPIDALIDAVICWESLFGVQTETTFRVTGAIAKLLEPTNLARREELHKELKDLYSRRSKLVHGGSEPRPDDVDKYRRRAIDVAANCFRALYRERADLLELTSDARGARLLLE